jgi:hypothetical protein
MSTYSNATDCTGQSYETGRHFSSLDFMHARNLSLPIVCVRYLQDNNVKKLVLQRAIRKMQTEVNGVALLTYGCRNIM